MTVEETKAVQQIAKMALFAGCKISGQEWQIMKWLLRTPGGEFLRRGHSVPLCAPQSRLQSEKDCPGRSRFPRTRAAFGGIDFGIRT